MADTRCRIFNFYLLEYNNQIRCFWCHGKVPYKTTFKMNINFPEILYCKNLFLWIHENCIYHFFSNVSYLGETRELPLTSIKSPICKQYKLNNHSFESTLPGIYILYIPVQSLMIYKKWKFGSQEWGFWSKGNIALKLT